MISSNYFQAIGKSIESLILGLSRQVILYIPLLLLLPHLWGINGVFYAMPFAAMACFGFILYELKHLGKLIKQEAPCAEFL
jgi:Na+-driven multidrug efflux pump